VARLGGPAAEPGGEVAPSLRWAIAKPERAANGGKAKGGQFNDEPNF
jgi:hypothetical protein